MTDIQIDAGTLTANADDRSVTGLLVPFNEECRSNLGKFSVEGGSFSIPADPAVVGFNLEHAREDVLGRATSVKETREGIVATFSVARTPEGDQALMDIASGERKHLSAEVANVVIRAGKAVGGRLFGGGLVKSPAFPSATLLAALEDLGDDPAAPADPEVKPTEVKTQHDGSVAISTDVLPLRIDVTTADPTGNETVTPYTTSTKPTTTPKEAAPVATATAPATLQASAPKIEETKAGSVFEAIRAVSKGNASADQQTLLAALSDIKTAGGGASQLPAAGVIQPSWLGEVWADKSYTRRYWNLVKNGSLTNMDEKGFLVDVGTALVQPYSGNKADMPSGTGSTSLVSSIFQRWAVAVDIAREFYDIPGNTEVIESFIRKVFDSYAKVTDKWALQQLITAAGTAVDADTFPAGYNGSIGKVLQGIDTLNATDVDATFVVVAPDVFKELLYTPKDLVPEFITLSAGTQGEGTADGVTVQRDTFGLVPAGGVLLGAHDAAHLNELAGGSPLTLDALDIARGGIDKAAHGYTQYMTEYAEGFLLVNDAAA